MSVIFRFFALFGNGPKDGALPPSASSSGNNIRNEQCVDPTNDAEQELLERVRSLGLRGPCDIQYASERSEAGKFLAVLPWPGDEDTIKHGAFISLTLPKEGGAVDLLVSNIRAATLGVAEKYGCEPLLTGPLMYAGGVLVMLFGIRQKVVRQ